MSLRGLPGNPIPGWDLILSRVNVKTAAWADAESIGARLYDIPDGWISQTLVFRVAGTLKSNPYDVPPDFQVATLNDYVKKDFVGQDRDQYMTALVGDFDIKGSYGGFSGTMRVQFDMSQETTQAYSFGTHTERWRLYSLKVPAGLDYSSPLLNKDFVSALRGEKSISVQEFYENWGTHFTSDIIIGGSASLSVYSQYKDTYDKQTFETDLSLAYESIAVKFQTDGKFQYDSQSSQESYSSNTALVLQGGDPTEGLDAWLKTVVDAPAFLDVNQEDPVYAGLTPMYELIPDENDPRRQELKMGLDDYLYPPLHRRIFAAASTLTEFPAATVSVPPPYKVLSGGARVTWQGPGELLTASFPISDSQWSARAHDALQQDTGILRVFAIGVYDPYNWLDVTIAQQTSAATLEQPTASVVLDADYAMTGGGADCNADSSGNPNFLTASFPYSDKDPRDVSFSSNTWQARGKDAFVVANGSVTAFAVGVKWSTSFLTQYGPRTAITAECLSLDSPHEAHPEAPLGPPDQTTLVGGGAYDRWDAVKTSQGNMLIDSYPVDLSTWHAGGKDHIASSPATLTVYTIGVKNMVPPPATAKVLAARR